MLRVFNDTARYVDQGGGKRKGAFAIYLEPWHADIFDFLDMRKNHGKEVRACVMGPVALTVKPAALMHVLVLIKPFVFAHSCLCVNVRTMGCTPRRRCARATSSTACGFPTCS